MGMEHIPDKPFFNIRSFIILCWSAVWLGGCGATLITPPEKLQEPTPVFVLEHGWTSSLVLPAADGSLYRYAYGDWAYYAERKTGSGAGLAALLWSTPAALGRKQMAGPATVASVLHQVKVPIDALHFLQVEQRRVTALLERLDGYFDRAPYHRPTPEVDLIFVPHPVPYSLRHNSNQVLADWLVELGCRLDDRPVLSGWKVLMLPFVRED